MLGYMEQTVAHAITKALTAVGTVKPKYPFITATKSALVYVAYHLKGKLHKLIVSMLHLPKPLRRYGDGEQPAQSRITCTTVVILSRKCFVIVGGG